MNLQRLAQMPLPVLFDRVRQEFSRAFDRRRLSGHGPGAKFRKPGRLAPDLRRLGVTDGGSGDLAQVASDCLDAAGRRFFPGALEVGAGLFSSEEMPALTARLRHSADASCAGRFSFLGYEDVFFGNPIDWHLDPVSGRHSPRLHWSRIDALDAAVVGDSKVVWELNRHQWLIRLGQVYRLSGEARYASVFARMISDWMRENPPGIGINWASSLEVAIRLISWSWTLVLFRDAPALTPALKAEMLAWIGIHAAHVDSYLSHSFSPNTHLTGEALGLYYAGTLFPELDAGGRWRRRGRKILLQELSKQVFEDGVYFEQSTCYQRYTAEIYLHFIVLARRNADSLPGFVGERTQALIDWLVAVQNPEGSMPRIGDEDGGWLLPLEVRCPDDYRGLFALAAAVFRRADYAWAARGESAEALWLLGRNGRRVLRGLAPRPPRTSASRHFPLGGYAVMRNNWRSDAHQLVFDVGPLGCHHSAGHGHADLLGIQCAAFGRPVLVDPGTYCYTPDPAWRNYFRSTFSHSTVVVDGTGQAVPLASFRWSARPAARMRAWNSAPGFDYADAEHDAYSELHGSPRHRRRILFVKHGYWVIVDDVTGDGIHELQVRYQFAPLERCTQIDGWMLGAVSKESGLMVRAFSAHVLTKNILSGSVDPVAGWISPAYGIRCPAPLLNYRVTGDLPVRIVSMLVPVAGTCTEPPRADVQFLDNNDCRIRIAGEEILIGAETASMERLMYADQDATQRIELEEGLSCAP